MLDSNFQTTIGLTGNFELRRAVERLRDGLFDPLGIRLLTMGEAKLATAFDRGAAAIEKGKSSHLCLCGAYGQGKSHSLNYIKQRAADQGFVVSYINLDPREVPFHQFKDVYRALMENITLPGGNGSLVTAWKAYAAQWLALPENRAKTCLDLIPEKMPHRFKAILTAMAGKNMAIPNGKKHLKKHARFKPREFPWVLKNALMGKELPAWRLRPALYYRQVSFFRKNSLVCRHSGQYLDAVLGMAELFRNMGFKGWVLLFDEGEAIGQARITARSRSYRLLDRMFSPDTSADTSAPGFYPVFAFTHDFFHQVAEEDYDRVRIRRRRDKTTDTTVEKEEPYFDRDYHAAWKNITVHSLHALSAREWRALIGKLIRLHGAAYRWDPPVEELQQAMEGELSKHRGSEARLKLKLLVNHLDLVHQEELLAEQP